MNPLLELKEFGQSYWLDNLTRKMITNGELEKRVREEGLSGVTSNPSIFNNAISKSSDYDDQIKELALRNVSIPEIYEALVIKDIQDACDILRPVFDSTGGLDGYVSLEVSPYLAHNTEATMAEARHLHGKVNRPNVLIKIPGTEAGIPAIEQMLYEGININITLLFSVASYEAVAQAYIRALERRLAEGKPLESVASVASFFLSRIDVLADQLLTHRIFPGQDSQKYPRAAHLLGRAAVASARLAYRSFKNIFSGTRWEKLAANGARVQRPLWASTSTKDPIYSDVLYVEPLIGPHTVNTMPEETISAFADHGKAVANTIEEGTEEAFQFLKDLAAVGLDLEFITRQLVNEGVQKFIDPYNVLMKTIAQKRADFLGKKLSRIQIAGASIQSKLQSAYKSVDSKQFGRRLFGKDASLWTSDARVAESIENRLGWLEAAEEYRKNAEEIKQVARAVKNAGFKHVVLLGMGGSSLCPEVASKTFGASPGWPALKVLDNTHPHAVKQLESEVDLEKTVFIVASKSGTTTETWSFYQYFYNKVEQLTPTNPGQQFIAITDPGTALVKEAQKRNFRHVFQNAPDIGGRYSALSFFGLVPMALMGIDIDEIMKRGELLMNSAHPFVPSEVNPAVALGASLGSAYRSGRDKITFFLSPDIHSFGNWVEQLIAESSGKNGRGILPVVNEPVAAASEYGNDRLFVYVSTEGNDDPDVLRMLPRLEDAGHPVVRIHLTDRYDLGGEFLRWEIATAIAGAILEVNPFDEPNVSESKQNTRQLLETYQSKGALDEGSPFLGTEEWQVYLSEAAGELGIPAEADIRTVFRAALSSLKPSDYVAVLAYLNPSAESDEALLTFRAALQKKAKCATTLGYGPRYLHSTGQLHKGGKNNGLFFLITDQAEDDVPIPGQPYGFAVLQRAQALGDFISLDRKKRRVVRIHLRGKAPLQIKKLAGLLSES